MTVSSNSKDLQWCYEMLGKVSRTFELPIKRLQSPKKEYVCILYLMCRIPDTIEDSPYIDPEEKSRHLKLYNRCVNNPSDENIQNYTESVTSIRPSDPLDKDHWDLTQNIRPVFRTFKSFPEETKGTMTRWISELVLGMDKFVTKYNGNVRISDIDELEEYCYYVAGTVGHMLAEINTENPSDDLHELAENYGLLLQTVNVSKDIHGDYYEEDNIYIPNTVLQEQNVEQDRLLDDGNIEGTTKAVEQVISYAENKVPKARKYLEKTTEEGDLEFMRSWAIPYLLAIATLRELKNNAKVSLTEGGVKMSREEVAKIIEATEEADVSDLINLESKIKNEEFKPS